MKPELSNAIIEKCKTNDKSAQRAVYDAFARLSFATAKRYVGDQSTAQDIVQNSFLKVFKYFKTFKGDGKNLKSWITKITINESLQWIKMNKKFLSIEVEPHHKILDDKKIGEIDAEYIYEAILTLPIRYRTVFNLYEIEGYSHKEIGEMLSINEGSSRSNLSRAKEHLKNKIEIYQKHIRWI